MRSILLALLLFPCAAFSEGSILTGGPSVLLDPPLKSVTPPITAVNTTGVVAVLPETGKTVTQNAQTPTGVTGYMVQKPGGTKIVVVTPPTTIPQIPKPVLNPTPRTTPTPIPPISSASATTTAPSTVLDRPSAGTAEASVVTAVGDPLSTMGIAPAGTAASAEQVTANQIIPSADSASAAAATAGYRVLKPSTLSAATTSY